LRRLQAASVGDQVAIGRAGGREVRAAAEQHVDARFLAQGRADRRLQHVGGLADGGVVAGPADVARAAGNQQGEVVGYAVDADRLADPAAVVDRHVARRSPQRRVAQGAEPLGRAGRQLGVEADPARDPRLAAGQAGAGLDEGVAVAAHGHPDHRLADAAGRAHPDLEDHLVAVDDAALQRLQAPQAVEVGIDAVVDRRQAFAAAQAARPQRLGGLRRLGPLRGPPVLRVRRDPVGRRFGDWIGRRGLGGRARGEQGGDQDGWQGDADGRQSGPPSIQKLRARRAAKPASAFA